MEYVQSDAEGNDVLFVGSQCGQIHTFLIYRRKFPRNLRPEVLSRDGQHAGTVTCIMYSANPDLSTSPTGIVVSGSSDRTIKIWSPNSSKPVCIQTLYGHEGTVTQVVDGHDGTLLSTSVDGSLRLWKPQRGRKMMLHHFLECTFVMKQKNAWLSSLAVSFINTWACYVGNMDGTIEIYRKGSEHNESEHRTAVFTGQLTKHKRWDHVHVLGIILMKVIFEENFLITQSNDNTTKILDLHLGTTLHSILNFHNCKYTGLVWDSANFQVFLCDEHGHLEVWSSFYERRVEALTMVTWRPEKRETRSIISGGNAGPTLAQLSLMPLAGPLQAFKSSDCLIALHPRTGHVTLWQVHADNPLMLHILF
jgi:WD40 repeat protein